MKLLLTTYVFDASAKTVVISDYTSGTLLKEGLLLITNVVDGIIIYNFADPTKGGTVTPDVGGDIVTLEYDTTSMDDADTLQIYYDDALRFAATVAGQEQIDNTLSYIQSETSLVKAAVQGIDSKVPSSIGQKTKAASLAVTLASDEDALPITDNGGSLTVDGTVAISNASIPVTDNGGNLSIDDGGNSITVDNPILSVVGGGTEATAQRVTIASDSTGVLSVDDNGSTLSIDDGGGNISIDDGGNSITVDGTITEANSAAIKTSVELIDDAIKTDDAAFTPATDKVLMIGAEFDDSSPDSVDEGDAGAVRMSGNRNLYVRIRDNAGNERGLNIDANGEPGISAIRSALPAGTNAIGKLAANDGVDIGDVTINNASLAVTLAAGAAAIAKAEDVASADADVGIPAMAVRKATPANTSGTDGDYEMLQMSAGRLWTSAVLEAGSAAIGKLAANSGVDIGDIDVTSIVPGSGATNLGKAEDAVHGDGDVGVMALSVRKNTAAATSGTDGDYQPLITDTNGRLHCNAINSGDVAHDAVDSGNPVKCGAKAYNALPTAVASADRADNISDLFGRILTSHIDPAMQVAITKTAYNTTSTQTGTAMWTPASGKRIAITSLVIGTYGTTAARVIIWFGGAADTTYSAGTDQAVVIASFAPSATVKPGLVLTPAVPIFCTTADNILRITTDAGISIDVTFNGYEY